MVKRRKVQPIYSNTYQTQRRHYWLTRAGIIGAVLVIFFGGWFFWQYQKQQRLNQFPVRGVALTQQAGFVDFQELARQNVDFAYLRATTGASYMDDQFQSGYDRVIGTNLPVGIYHVFSFSTTPKAQFENFKKEVGTRSGSLPIAVQISLYSNYTPASLKRSKMGQKLLAFVNQVKADYGKPVLIWCSQKVWRAVKNAGLSQNARWLVTSNPGQLPKRVRFIEYDAEGSMKLNGQNQPVSLSVFNGTKKQWQQFIGSR